MDARHPHTQRLREGSIAEMFGRMLDKFSDNDSPSRPTVRNWICVRHLGFIFLVIQYEQSWAAMARPRVSNTLGLGHLLYAVVKALLHPPLFLNDNL
jgi:hypothetical protein